MSDETFFERAYQLEGNQTKAFYAQWAATYDQELIDANGYAQPQRCAQAMDRLLADRGARILDMGCGTGLAGVAMSQAGYESIVGCDYSPEMLAGAVKTGAYERVFEADLNAHPLDIGTATFDAITAVGVFGSAHVAAPLIDEMVRILIAGGVFVICLNEPWWLEGSLEARIAALETAGAITVDLRERGAHVPSHGVMGWVVAGRKT